ncbi:MAG: peptide-methionine (S)-S-oxide reductase MsrA [Bacteroidota bacterium]
MKQIFVILLTLAMSTVACTQQSGETVKAGFVNNKIKTISDYVKDKGYDQYEVATIAGGCFWCTEAALDRINGVVDVISGYTDGETKFPTYEQVCSGRTGHTEAIMVYYDPAVVSFEKLLEVFFVAHDGTQLNRQGPDVGTQYRSGIYYHNEAQKQAAEAYIAELNKTGAKPIVTEVDPYTEFYVAEEYHQDYYEHNPGNPYVQRVSGPKVKKVMKAFKDILKEEFKS